MSFVRIGLVNSFGIGSVFRIGSVISFGLDRLFLSDWIYQKYSSQALPESEGTLDFIVSLRIVGLQNILINH